MCPAISRQFILLVQLGPERSGHEQEYWKGQASEVGKDHCYALVAPIGLELARVGAEGKTLSPHFLADITQAGTHVKFRHG